MNLQAQANQMTEGTSDNVSLTPDFSPVVTGLGEPNPFKRLLALALAGTRLKPGVIEK